MPFNKTLKMKQKWGEVYTKYQQIDTKNSCFNKIRRYDDKNEKELQIPALFIENCVEIKLGYSHRYNNLDNTCLPNEPIYTKDAQGFFDSMISFLNEAFDYNKIEELQNIYEEYKKYQPIDLSGLSLNVD